MIVIKELDSKFITQLYDLQEEVFKEGYNEDLLRHNSLEDFNRIFKYKHTIIGIFYNNQLVSFGILYISDKNEILSSNELKILSRLCGEKKEILNVGVVKLIIVKKQFRGKGYQRQILACFEKFALSNNINLLIASVSLLNIYSLNNFQMMGYVKYKMKKLYGGHKRIIFYKFINNVIN